MPPLPVAAGLGLFTDPGEENERLIYKLIASSE